MTSGAPGLDGRDDARPGAGARPSRVGAVSGLSEGLTQAPSPAEAVRVLAAAVPSIVPGRTAVAWHHGAARGYCQRAPDAAARALAALTGPGRLDVVGLDCCWAFPLTSPRGPERAYLVTVGNRDLAEQDRLLLSVLAQLCGTVIANHELRDEAELRAEADRARDVAQARAAELAASAARQRVVLEAALDAVVSIDDRARVTYVNSAFEQIFGYRAADVIGRELADVIVPPSLRDAHRAGFAHYRATREPHILDQRLELAAVRADGTVFPAEVTITRSGSDAEPAFTGYLRDITERQRARQELMASRARLVAASDVARQRITRDLHDGAQQRLVTTVINLQLAEQKWESAPQRARELLGLALTDARQAIDGLREIAAGIHPAILTQRGLAAAIGALTARLPLPVELDVPGRRLPDPVEASVYFFCAEALTNVVKHARAGGAWVRVAAVDGRCDVEVGDDGVGGASLGSQSGGLAGLADRIGALNGTLDVVSPDAGGTVLRARIPLIPLSPVPS